ncbi:MAG: hypothetical protein ACT4N2_06290 [Hyphomicrobium sp.]
MTTISTFRTLAAAAALVSGAGLASANEAPALGIMKPSHGISFDIGASRGVSYFQAVNGTCKLVLTMAGEPDWSAASSFKVTRFEAAVPAGGSTRYQAEGQALEFSCQPGAATMSAKAVSRVTAGDAQ